MNIPVADGIFTNPTPKYKRLLHKQGGSLAIVLFLLIAYASFSFLRCWLTFRYSANPFILPDEMVYSNFARSLFEDFSVAMRNRPASYDNILYPLLLAPFYGLPPETDIFRTIQIFNNLLMNLAVFPAYGLAVFFTEKKWLRVLIALGALLMPDMVMAGRVMTECITYPLFLALVLLCFHSFDKKNIWFQLIPSFVSLLLYLSKSGAVGLTLAYAAVLLIYGIKAWRESRDSEQLKKIAVFMGSYIIFFFSFRLFMAVVAGMDYGLTNLYASQTNGLSDTQIAKTLTGTALYSFYAIIGFGVLPLLIPCCHWHDYPMEKRRQVLFVAFGIALYIFSISYIFYGSEGSSVGLSGRIHTRYLFPFIPVCWAMLSYPLKREQSRLNTPMVIGFALALSFLVINGFASLVSDRTMPVDAILLSHIAHDYSYINLRELFALIYTFFILLCVWFTAVYGWAKRGFKVLTVCFIAGVLICSNITGYDTNRHNLEADLASDVRYMVGELEGESVLMIGANQKYFDNHLSALDVSLRHAPYYIMVADMCEQLEVYGRLLDSYTTPQYWMEDIREPIPQGSIMVFSSSSEQKIKFNENAEVKKSPKNYYIMAKPSAGNRVFHSVLAGVSNYVPQHNAAIWIFDEQSLRKTILSVGMYIKSENTTGSFTISLNENKSETFNTDTSGRWVYFSFTVPEGATHIKLPITEVTGDVMIVDFNIR